MLPTSLKAQFAAAIRRMMRPVVRQMIAYGVSYPTFSQIAKELYVEVAESDFALPFKRQTDSRLALVTGLRRKEVAKLREQLPSGERVPVVEDTLVTHVIGRWMAGPPYAAEDDGPRRLPYEVADIRTPSFAHLVRESGSDIPVRAVLDEMLRLGSVRLLSNGSVELRQEAHIPISGAEGKLTLLGSDPAELFRTIAHNIDHQEFPWLQRKVVYDNIGAGALAAVQAEARRLGESFVRRANALLAAYDRDRNPDAPAGERSRVVLGVYYFEEPGEKPEPPHSPGGPVPLSRPPGRIRKPS